MANLISNLIKKFEFEPNFNLVELELEPEPCDIASNNIDRLGVDLLKTQT